ncbi:cysteine-rich CWC family protein [Arsenicibacter rosenii]|uniref:cysteine-rich CWC family protein n=1 Tax=Arsenicibacter rosenii TaxID=1750698 RepID=UPI0015A50320|nr:cysteine-rich CWC family protein [Arsenicibacter rosenii]
MQTRPTTCPRCGEPVSCGVSAIGHCPCAGIVLTEPERAYIRSQFTDCLCITCLKTLQEACQVQKTD